MVVPYNRYKFVAVSIPKRLRNGRFNFETAVRRAACGGFRSEIATWIQKRFWFKISAGASRKPYFRYNSFLRRVRWAWL
jgi:hypothetical protein